MNVRKEWLSESQLNNRCFQKFYYVWCGNIGTGEEYPLPDPLIDAFSYFHYWGNTLRELELRKREHRHAIVHLLQSRESRALLLQAKQVKRLDMMMQDHIGDVW